ncbi:Uncharacterised protein [Mycobacteroides abscessus]|nr:Uncharacterised protein [Mycobacteroides abscessus]
MPSLSSGPRINPTVSRSTRPGWRRPSGSLHAMENHEPAVANGTVPVQMTAMTARRNHSGPPTARYTSKATDLCSSSSIACQYNRFRTSSSVTMSCSSLLSSRRSASTAV